MEGNTMGGVDCQLIRMSKDRLLRKLDDGDNLFL